MKGTLDQMKKEISTLTNLLKKKRENFDSKFSYSIVDNPQKLNDFDLFTLSLNGKIEEDNINMSQDIYNNERSFKILYKKMKEFIFEDEKKNEIRKITKNNKRIIGIV